MPRKAHKTLQFPLSGLGRNAGYHDVAPPYTTPYAVNIRGVSNIERRKRGGSRPGLSLVVDNDFGTTITAVSAVTSIDGSGNRNRDLVVVADGALSYLRASTVTSPSGKLQTPDGVDIITDDGDSIVFDTTVSSVNPGGDSNAFDTVERNGKLLLADSVLKEWDPLTGVVSTVADSGEATVPTGCPLICQYSDRIFLSGADHLWYASRQGDHTDWDFGGDIGDNGRPVVGHCESAGKIGEVVKAMIPHGDAFLYFASHTSLWLLRGDPAVGSLSLVSSEIGVISPTAWAKSPEGLIAFLSNDGAYMMPAGGNPVMFSEARVPSELRNVDPTTNIIIMSYDIRGRGFHLFITPATGTGTHWWLDVENKALWPVLLQDDHQPIAASRWQDSTGLSEIILGCKDGYLRKFDNDATDDDGENIESHILLGPFRVSSDDAMDGIIDELYGLFADNSGSITWRVVVGETAESVADTGVAGITTVLAGGTPTGVAASGTWAENRNKTVRPRARGPWALIWLASSAVWAYESIVVGILQLGRKR